MKMNHCPSGWEKSRLIVDVKKSKFGGLSFPFHFRILEFKIGPRISCPIKCSQSYNYRPFKKQINRARIFSFLYRWTRTHAHQLFVNRVSDELRVFVFSFFLFFLCVTILIYYSSNTHLFFIISLTILIYYST